MNPSRRSRFKSHFIRRVNWGDMDFSAVIKLIEMARMEDLGPETVGLGFSCDVTSQLLAKTKGTGRAELMAREPMTVCGVKLVPLILDVYRAQVTFSMLAQDGDTIARGQSIGFLSGLTTHLLTVERVVLNFLQYLSGIATQTARFVRALGDSPTKLLDTRKTTPGFRLLDKYAVACGGGWNHRLGLYDRIMLKDNHLAAENALSGNRLSSLVSEALLARPDLPVQVEVESTDQIEPVIQAGADCIMLDNFSFNDLEKAVKKVNRRILTEASGGITLERLPALSQLGLDFVSTGATVHQARWVDIGLDWRE